MVAEFEVFELFDTELPCIQNSLVLSELNNPKTVQDCYCSQI